MYAAGRVGGAHGVAAGNNANLLRTWITQYRGGRKAWVIAPSSGTTALAWASAFVKVVQVKAPAKAGPLNVGAVLSNGVKLDLTELGVRRAAQHDGPHPVVEQVLAAAAEMGEGPFVGRQQVGHGFVQKALGVAEPAVAQGHDEDVHLGWLLAQGNRDLPPDDLGLVARSGFEAALCQAGKIGFGTQGPYGQLDGLVAAAKAALTTQFLMQDARGVIDLRRTLRKPGSVLIQNGGTTDLPPVRRPFALAHPLEQGLGQCLDHLRRRIRRSGGNQRWGVERVFRSAQAGSTPGAAHANQR